MDHGIVPMASQYRLVVEVHARNVYSLPGPRVAPGWLKVAMDNIAVDSEHVNEIDEEKKQDGDPRRSPA